MTTTEQTTNASPATTGQTKMSNNNESLICGNQVQIDRSGQGHNWKDIDAQEIPASVREEIEGEMIDGGKDEAGLFIASNGLHYRW